MKRQTLLVIMMLVLLLFSSLMSVFAIQKIPYIHSHGTIEYDTSSLTVFMRHMSIQYSGPPADINQFVDNWVENNAYGTKNWICILAPDYFHGVIAYGYDFSKTSGTWYGWTFNQLKQLIDRFHYHGWKVIHETVGVAYGDHESYNYIVNKHPELSFMNAEGNRYLSGSFLINQFSKWASDDVYLNISTGDSLSEVYAERLKQQYLDGLEWDGWFGTDGWNGFTIWRVYYGSSWGASPPPKTNHFSFSYQEIDKWANDPSPYGGQSVSGFPPENWGAWNNLERADWIRNNALSEWFYYWSWCHAGVYAQIRSAMREVNPDFVMFRQMDVSAEWTGPGQASPSSLLNITMMEEQNAIDYYIILTEGTGIGGGSSDLKSCAELGKLEAYTAGLVKSKSSKARLITGMQVQYSSNIIPNWVCKQEYLAQIQNYVWVNGTRIRATEPDMIWIQYPKDLSGFHAGVRNLFDWIKSVNSVMASKYLQPLYLGPTYNLWTRRFGSGVGIEGFSYTFAQWVDVLNIRNHPEYINASMSPFFTDMLLSASAWSQLLGLQDRMLELFASGNLSIVMYSQGHSPTFSPTVWGSDSSENLADETFHIFPSVGQSLTYQVLSGIDDPFGAWIASGYEGLSIDLSSLGSGCEGNYKALTGFIPIVNYTDGSVAMGIYYNDTSARFLYGRWLSNGITGQYLPRAIINRAIYWVSDCTINSSEPLIDLKVFRLKDAILIPMMNHKNMGGSDIAWQGEDISSILNINSVALGLGEPTTYKVYWQSSHEDINVVTWNHVPITLTGMADVLVISPNQ